MFKLILHSNPSFAVTPDLRLVDVDSKEVYYIEDISIAEKVKEEFTQRNIEIDIINLKDK